MEPNNFVLLLESIESVKKHSKFKEKEQPNKKTYKNKPFDPSKIY
ncbi:hypothetical protein [Oceanirhabdus sp. W0125-5]|nr:hypothetical protein [Oceanirhabdus sp. W0125-5]WBW95284.1 hypothetical protein OW730_16500 [Oceanirhabdus sp. W0125-5]